MIIDRISYNNSGSIDKDPTPFYNLFISELADMWVTTGDR
jgi:hypothetical protein